MVKLIALFRFKPDLDRDAGIGYYENNHVPLATHLFNGLLVDYRRNYLIPGSRVTPDHLGGTPGTPQFDVVTELWFDRRAEFDEMMTRIADPETGRRLAADEANFLDHASMTLFLVEERGARTPVTMREVRA